MFNNFNIIDTEADLVNGFNDTNTFLLLSATPSLSTSLPHYLQK